MHLLIRLQLFAVMVGLLTFCVFALGLGRSSADPREENTGGQVSVSGESPQRERLQHLYRASHVPSFGGFVATLLLREQLEQLHGTSHRLRDAKRQAVQDAIDRRTPLAEMIAVLQALDQEWSAEVPVPTLAREETYRRILDFVAEILRGRPQEAEAVVCRLEREYRQLQAKN